jgi:Signal transduction histidine kinase regulating citrate/malate metabolism
MSIYPDIEWIILDLANTLLIFILTFMIFPKSFTKLNVIISIIFASLSTKADLYMVGTSTILIILLYFFIVRKTDTKIIEKLLSFILILFTCTFTQSIGAYVQRNVFHFPYVMEGGVAVVSAIVVIVTNYALSLLIYYIVTKLIDRFNLKYILKDTVVEWIILISFIILTASYFGLSIVSKYLHIQQIYIAIILVSTMVTLIFIGIGMTVFIVGHLSKVKADYELQQISERNAYINGLEEKNNELRRFKHDYKNFLLSLSASIENNQDDSEIVQRLLNYADVNLQNDTKPSDANLYKINDKLIRGIIITKVMIARDKGIQTNVEIAENVEIPQKSSIDITRILGILFDNAIEASLKNPKPELDFALISYDESVEFVFKNNVDPTATIEMSKLYDLGYSTKSNHNGLGLATVKKIVNSNKNFLLQTKFKNSKFSTVLTSMKK